MQQPQQLRGLAQAQQQPRQQMQSTLQHKQRIPGGRRRRQRRRQRRLDATVPCAGCARARSVQRVRKHADARSGGDAGAAALQARSRPEAFTALRAPGGGGVLQHGAGRAGWRQAACRRDRTHASVARAPAACSRALRTRPRAPPAAAQAPEQSRRAQCCGRGSRAQLQQRRPASAAAACASARTASPAARTHRAAADAASAATLSVERCLAGRREPAAVARAASPPLLARATSTPAVELRTCCPANTPGVLRPSTGWLRGG
jgi:hypothetical protein